MTSHPTIALFLTLATGATMLAGCQQELNSAQIELGGIVYAENCATCHGPEGEGEYPEASLEPGPDGLFGAPPHNQTGHTWHHADSLLIETITNGSSYPGFKPMPAFGETLSPAEMEAVLAYIKTLWSQEQRDLQAQVSEGRTRTDVPTIRELAGEEQ